MLRNDQPGIDLYSSVPDRGLGVLTGEQDDETRWSRATQMAAGGRAKQTVRRL